MITMQNRSNMTDTIQLGAQQHKLKPHVWVSMSKLFSIPKLNMLCYPTLNCHQWDWLAAQTHRNAHNQKYNVIIFEYVYICCCWNLHWMHRGNRPSINLIRKHNNVLHAASVVCFLQFLLNVLIIYDQDPVSVVRRITQTYVYMTKQIMIHESLIRVPDQIHAGCDSTITIVWSWYQSSIFYAGWLLRFNLLCTWNICL